MKRLFGITLIILTWLFHAPISAQQHSTVFTEQVKKGKITGTLWYSDLFNSGADKKQVDSIYQDILNLPPHQNQLINIQLAYAEAVNRKGGNETAIELLDKLADTIELCSNLEKSDYYSVLGVISLASANPELALKYADKAIALMTDTTHHETYQKKLMRRGVVLNALELHEEALQQFLEAEQLNPYSKHERNKLYLKLNKAVCFLNMDKPEEAKEVFLEAVEITKTQKDHYALIRTYGNIADIYRSQDSLLKAEAYYFKAIDAAMLYEQHHDLFSFYQGLSNIYVKQGDFEKAFYAKVFSDSIDAIYNGSEVVDNITQLEVKNINYHNKLEQELQATKHKQEQLASQNEINTRNYLIIISVILTVSILLVLIIIFFRYRKTKEQNQLIAAQKRIIDKEKKATEDSINYAKEIQTQLLQKWNDFQDYFPKAELVYLPKDIVSGDFYWFNTDKEHTLIAVGDCTGHGVPGAFMTILCLNILAELEKQNLRSCTEIMNQFNEMLMQKLQGKNADNDKFGLELSLCRINRTKKELVFIGTKQRMLIVKKNGSTKELKGNKAAIGQLNQEFSEQKECIEDGDVLYIYTDGMPDQKGGINGKKLFYKPFNELLINTSKLPANERKNHLLNALEQWKGNQAQIDDITIVSIEI
ncbi:SpoIIE family protein phosphatase [Parvicella tangerina]|nr:SpoIIE family protein phosphatase [Parvicella tangerina]